MNPNIKRKCAFSGSKVNAKTEIIVHFYTKISKKNYLYVNTLRKQVNVLKENNAYIDTFFQFLRIQTICIIKNFLMDNFQEMKHVLITKEVFVTKELNVNL
jgi:hypothetical protein